MSGRFLWSGFVVIFVSCVIIVIGALEPVWLVADLGAVKISYGLLELCEGATGSDRIICEPFWWPNHVNGTATYKVMAIEACSLASAAAAGVLVLLLGSLSLFVCGDSCCCCGSSMRWVLKTMDTVILLFVLCAVASSCMFFMTKEETQLHVHSAVGWAFYMYLVGRVLVIASRFGLLFVKIQTRPSNVRRINVAEMSWHTLPPLPPDDRLRSPPNSTRSVTSPRMVSPTGLSDSDRSKKGCFSSTSDSPPASPAPPEADRFALTRYSLIASALRSNPSVGPA